jgi:hypothetical protein
MHARQKKILSNGSYKDGIEINTKWVVTLTTSNKRYSTFSNLIWKKLEYSVWQTDSMTLFHSYVTVG